MSRVRKIERRPTTGRNYYLVDSSFLANKHIPPSLAPVGNERRRVEACKAWWDEIEAQLKHDVARVFIPDICIAEAFKVLAKKYYQHKWFKRSSEWKRAREALSRDVRTHTKTLKSPLRRVPFHDISTNRDIIISVDRFFEVFLKDEKTRTVSVPDLIILATAKYLMEFFDVPWEQLHIVTLDAALRLGTKKMGDLPAAYDPTQLGNRAELVFVGRGG